MRRAPAFIALSLQLGLAACSDEPAAPPPSDDAGHPDAATEHDAGTTDASTTDAGGIVDDRFRTILATPADLAALTSTIAGNAVKYLAQVEGREPFSPLTESCYFQNMELFSYHLQFLRSFPEHAGLTFDAYLALVLNPDARKMWGGAIQTWAGTRHPITQAPGIVSYAVYSNPGTLTKEDIIAVDQRLKSCIIFARDLLVYVPEGSDQKSLLIRERDALRAAGVASIFPEELLSGVPHEPYSRGEAYGTLKIVPEGQPLEEYGPRDVVVVEAAPNDISIVAGLLTKHPQNPLGHVNLRLREKGTPNAAVPMIYEAAWIRALDGALVHLTVTDDDFEITPARLEDAEEFWERTRPVVPQPEADLSISTLKSFDDMRATDRRAFGVKAANLGELHALLSAPHRNDGFGIPFAAFDAHLTAANLKSRVADLAADPQMKSDAAYKRQQLEALRDDIKDAPLDPAVFAAVRAQIEANFGANAMTQRVRFRSSTNVEDLDVLTGAGLYDSKSGCLADDLDADRLGPSACLKQAEADELNRRLTARRQELLEHPERNDLQAIIDDLEGDLTEEKEISRAIKRVWASLYFERAWDEREYYGIAQTAAYMGIAVNPSFVLERANAVAVSNLTVDAGAPLYRLNSQVGTESVVQPDDPTAVAELLTFRRENNEPTNIRVELYSNLLPANEEVWPREQLDILAGLLFEAHDHFATNIYPNISPLSLDFEIKHTEEGDVAIKQVRPYVSRDP